MKDQFDKINEQLHLEEKTKQEKIQAIHSLTATLNENKVEIERLRTNFAELETSRRNEVQELKTQLVIQETGYENQLTELKDGKALTERKLKEEIIELKESMSTYQSQCDHLRLSLEQRTNQTRLTEQQHEREIQKLALERDSYNEKVIRLEEQAKELNKKWTESNSSWESSQKELSKIKSLLENAREELDKRKSELCNSLEGVRNLELDKSLLQSTINDLKQELEVEKVANKEKFKQIGNLKDLLSSSHLEIDE